ncbi:MAG TPA: sulfatase [Chroococcales cyanobacterium]
MTFRIFVLVALLICPMDTPAAHGKHTAEQSSGARKHHNVLLLIGDDQGLDMGAYGNELIMTPNLDELASKGTLFTQGYATVSSCSPSRSVIYSGLYSHSNGMYGLAHDVHNQHLLPWVKTLPSLLKANGYATCLVGKKHILPESSLQFDVELAPEKPGPRDVAFMAEQADQFISQHKSDPFLLVVGFSDPHRAEKDFGTSGGATPSLSYKASDISVPAQLPDLPEVREDLVHYYEAVTRLDAGVGLILDKLKSTNHSDDTLVIYVSDNGRPFAGGKTTLYDDGIHLPLVILSPQQTEHGVRNDAMVSWIDILPTILSWTGSAPPSYKLPGRSLLPILNETHSEGWDRIFASHNFHEIDQYYPMRAMRTRQYKFIRNLANELPYPISTDIKNSPSWKAIVQQGAPLGTRSLNSFLHRDAEELYDLSKDPQEVHNVAGDSQYKNIASEMRDQLDTFGAATNDPWISR